MTEQPSSPVTPPDLGWESATLLNFQKVVLLRDDITPTVKTHMVAAAMTGSGAAGTGVMLAPKIVARRCGGKGTSLRSIEDNLRPLIGTWFRLTEPARTVAGGKRWCARYELMIPVGSLAAWDSVVFPNTDKADKADHKNRESRPQESVGLTTTPERESVPVFAVEVSPLESLPSADGIDSKDLAKIMAQHRWTRDWAVRVIEQKRPLAPEPIRSLPAYIQECVKNDPDGTRPTFHNADPIRDVLARQAPIAPPSPSEDQQATISATRSVLRSSARR